MTLNIETPEAAIRAIKARAEAATPGPWRWNKGEKSLVLYADNPSVRSIIGKKGGGTVQDMTFIAHARTDVPWLADYALALRARLLELGEKLEGE